MMITIDTENTPQPGTRSGAAVGKDTAANTHHIPSAAERRLRRQADAYIDGIMRECARILGARRRHRDLDDITDVVLDRFLLDQARAMADFPDPRRFVAANIDQCIVGFDRHDRKGRCAGTRLASFRDEAGCGRRVARLWDSLDAVHVGSNGESFSLYELAAGADTDERSLEDRVIGRVDAQRRIDRLTHNVDPAQRRLVEMVDGYDFEVKEVARSVGITREAMSRKVNGVRAVIRQNAADLPGSGIEGGNVA
jgi:hypothetical protein